MRYRLLLVACLLALVLGIHPTTAQDNFDASWYNPNQTYVKIGVVEDGMYQVTGSELAAAGVNLGSIDVNTLALLDKGNPIPIHYDGNPSSFGSGDAFFFVGQRNTGEDDLFAYNYNPNGPISTYYSIYTDSTFYWLTWGGTASPRYTDGPAGGGATPISVLPDHIHFEEEAIRNGGFSSSLSGDPLYIPGEGWVMANLFHNTSPNDREFEGTVDVTGIDRSGGTMDVTVTVLGSTGSPHQVILEARLTRASNTAYYPIDTLSWTGFGLQRFTGSIAQNEVPTGADELEIRVVSKNGPDVNPLPGSNLNGVRVDYLEFDLNRKLTSQNGQTKFSATAAGTFQFTLDGFTPSTQVLILNPENDYKYETSTGAFTASVPAPTTFWGAEEGSYRTAAHIALDVSSDLASPSNTADYVIITTPFLRSSAENMASYRRSEQGGSYDVMVIDVNDIFDQFDYGRGRSIAIRRFVLAARSWATPPEYLMLWGDALYVHHQRDREPWEVISYGWHSSDAWFSMQYDAQGNYDQNDYTEELHTGRIPIRSNEEGALFLQKIQTYEAAPPGDWQKDVLVLAGGATDNEQLRLQNASNDWANTVESAPFGGYVEKYYKTSDTVLDPTFRDSLQGALKQGVSWIGYFGHSDAREWEILTDPPAQFDNAAVLPVALSLGCYNGAFGDDETHPVFAEEVVLSGLSGSIAHWGGTTTSFISSADAIADYLYDVVFTDGERILGKAMTEAKRQYFDTGSYNEIKRYMNLQYSLIGDPATRMNLPSAPDLYLQTSQISIAPFAPNPADETLDVTVTVRNRGLVPDGNVDVQLTHWGPDDVQTVYTEQITPIQLSETVVFSVPITNEMVGDNRFQVHVDPGDAYAEIDEFNNTAERNQVIFSSGLALLYPLPYGVVPTTEPTLRVSLASQDAQEMPVLFELDTSPTFDSPNLTTGRVSAPLTVDWTVDSPLQDDQTYWWRARVDDPAQPAEDWKTGAFTVRTDFTGVGWYQQGNLFADAVFGEHITQSNGTWAFKTFEVPITIYYGGDVQVKDVKYFEDKPGWRTLVLQGITDKARAGNFDNSTSELNKLVAVVDEALPGDLLIVRSNTTDIGTYGTEPPQQVKDLFGPYSNVVETVSNSDYWVMVTRVGETEGQHEILDFVGGPSEEGDVAFEADYQFPFTSSDVSSVLIGPARSWDEAGFLSSWSSVSGEINVEVLDQNDNLLLSSSMDPASTETTIDLSGLNANTYPYLKLRADFSEPLATSTPQLENWYVLYDPIPELVMNPAEFAVSADSVAEGEQISVSASISNMSTTDAHDVLLTYEVVNAVNESVTLATDTLQTLAAGTSVIQSHTFSSTGFAGPNRVLLRARQLDAQEQIIYNNLAIGEFFVRADRTPPVYTVRLDGAEYPSDPRRITSTDDVSLPFVQARPTIEITIEDENEYLLLTDTSYVSISLDEQEISLDRPDVVFEPATEDENEIRLIFTPDFAAEFFTQDPDTVHTLKLWAEDASGNKNPTELEPYVVHFRVQTEMEVETVYPYPNPMSSYTQFAFRLRGMDAALVEDFRIRIYTVSGQLIRQFDLIDDPSVLDGGGLKIGWNKVAWDGTDEDGDPVGTGVYLYKVFLRTDGESVDNGGSRINKLVVLR